MKNPSEDFCFCTLALGRLYQSLAQDLARDIEKYAPGKFLVVGTDDLEAFREYKNVIVFQQRQTGIVTCYNDKRFVLAKSLLDFSSVIVIDADTKLINDIPKTLHFFPGITAYHKNVLEHLQKYRPQNLEFIQKIATKLKISLTESSWIAESLFVVTRDQGKEQEFIKYWGIISRYMELRGMYSGEGNIMGLAATKAGLKVQTNEAFQILDQAREHLVLIDKSVADPSNFWEKSKAKLAYYYRLNKTRLATIKDFYNNY